MNDRKNVMALFTCYVLWGFQPLYWALLSHLDSFLILFCRIVMAAVFSVLILGFTHRLSELKALFQNSKSRSEIVATFLAILELCKSSRIRLAGTGSDCTVVKTDAEPEEETAVPAEAPS